MNAHADHKLPPPSVLRIAPDSSGAYSREFSRSALTASHSVPTNVFGKCLIDGSLCSLLHEAVSMWEPGAELTRISVPRLWSLKAPR